jgi:hypothetical protein
MHDVIDYLRRLFYAVFLCPAAAAFWVSFGLSGFSVGDYLAFLGALSNHYAALDADGQGAFVFQAFAGWSVLAFVFLLLTFAVNPPRFRYELKEEGDHKVVSVID